MYAKEIIEAVVEQVKAELSKSQEVLEGQLTPKHAEQVAALLTIIPGTQYLILALPLLPLGWLRGIPQRARRPSGKRCWLSKSEPKRTRWKVSAR